MLEPLNRYIRVYPIEKKKENNDLSFVLPDDYKEPESPYVTCEVLQISKESKYFEILSLGQKIVVERRMLLSIDLGEETTYLVLENYIYGRINNEID
jgi:hypothetical protein